MLRKIILFAYVIVITGLSLLPSDALLIPESVMFAHADKVAHFGMYAVFTFMLFYAFPKRFSGRLVQFLPLIYVLVWGTIMEILQGIGGYGRNPSLPDIFANALGFFPGWIAWRWIFMARVMDKAGQHEPGKNT